ncbi:hypothetical protein CDL15_Pgr010252 [Punica granatum]|uniref:Uncharacterized protein n=1 Tax=Punica granatum TaxID=22663 RepID=A0A218XQV7_PUNGR|nr:hypothetical protein CDL15_Pgr010252 [Punica granatum]
MWRQKPFPAAADSDQSFSDDEDFDGDSSRNCISLSGCAETEKQPGCVLEDDVEIPSFGIESGFICSPKRSPKCCSDEEMISDDEKDEPSSSFTLQDDNVVSRLACELPESAEHRESRTVACSAGNNLADSEEEMNPQSSIACPVEVPRHGYTDHSMAELLDGLHERTGLARGINKSSRKRGQRMQSVGKRSMTTILDSEDEPMSMDSDSPGEEESDFDNLKIPPPQRKRHTLVDCFQEVLDASPWRDRVALAANPSGSGLFERLQQEIVACRKLGTTLLEITRTTKNKRELKLSWVYYFTLYEYAFLTASSGGTSCLHVLILSSYLDAKLIVCRCSLKKIPEVVAFDVKIALFMFKMPPCFSTEA